MLIARIGQFLSDVARHAVPVGGIFGADWHPVTALGIYWLESVLLALIASVLSVLMQRRTSSAAIEQARSDGDTDRVEWLETQRSEAARAKIQPADVFGFHVGSLLAFGFFLGGVIFMLSENGKMAEPIRWAELRQAVQVIAAVVAAGFVIDLWGFRATTPAMVRARVDACMTRWGLFWLVGFFGSILIGVTGRATVFFGFFALLKITIESYGRLARAFGWGTNPPTPRRSVYDSPTPRT